MSAKTTITIETATQTITLPEEEAREVLEVLSRLFAEKRGYPVAAPSGPTWRDLSPPFGPMERRPLDERFPRPSHPVGPMQPIYPGVAKNPLKVSSEAEQSGNGFDM